MIFTSYTELEPQHRVRYISNEKNSYAPLQETVLYTVGKGGRIEYKGFSGKRFADYVERHEHPKWCPVAETNREMDPLIRSYLEEAAEEQKL